MRVGRSERAEGRERARAGVATGSGEATFVAWAVRLEHAEGREGARKGKRARESLRIYATPWAEMPQIERSMRLRAVKDATASLKAVQAGSKQGKALAKRKATDALQKERDVIPKQI